MGNQVILSKKKITKKQCTKILSQLMTCESAFAVVAPNGNFSFVNESLVKLLKYPNLNSLQSTPFAEICPDFQPHMKEITHKAIVLILSAVSKTSKQTNSVVSHVFPFQLKDYQNKPFWAQLILTPVIFQNYEYFPIQFQEGANPLETEELEESNQTTMNEFSIYDTMTESGDLSFYDEDVDIFSEIITQPKRNGIFNPNSFHDFSTKSNIPNLDDQSDDELLEDFDIEKMNEINPKISIQNINQEIENINQEIAKMMNSENSKNEKEQEKDKEKEKEKEREKEQEHNQNTINGVGKFIDLEIELLNCKQKILSLLNKLKKNSEKNEEISNITNSLSKIIIQHFHSKDENVLKLLENYQKSKNRYKELIYSYDQKLLRLADKIEKNRKEKEIQLQIQEKNKKEMKEMLLSVEGNQEMRKKLEEIFKDFLEK
ncbi:a-type inclusion protein [Anaeramoeba ignava]|uniref:A-type inclusion protein n=1 Tax=Anaeramoeba ignava TaxID=1746090 RepID=A0A9Q0L4V2_ANAIG|nr:a-type inclusion protein [Anaeramoeba ignava]